MNLVRHGHNKHNYTFPPDTGKSLMEIDSIRRFASLGYLSADPLGEYGLLSSFAMEIKENEMNTST